MEFENNFIIWGDICDCGKECSILQNKVHPWDNSNFITRIECPQCGNVVEINKDKAEKFYNEKILSYFNNVDGTVMDIGCGGGFLTNHIVKLEDVTKVYSIDKDLACNEEIKAIEDKHNKVKFYNMDISNLSNQFQSKSIDYIISRDVFMFIDNTTKFFDDINKIVVKGIKIMGWYMPSNKRINNALHPEDICKGLNIRGWKTTLECLNWYKHGYYISAEARNFR